MVKSDTEGKENWNVYFTAKIVINKSGISLSNRRLLKIRIDPETKRCEVKPMGAYEWKEVSLKDLKGGSRSSSKRKTLRKKQQKKQRKTRY